MKRVQLVFLALALVVSASVMARTPEPIVDLFDQPVATASGKTPTVEEVQQALKHAAESKKWLVTPQADGKMLASLSWHNKHTIVVELAGKAESFSISYKDSVQMNFRMRDEKPVIHPYYNRFVGELRDAIRVELMKL